ncbi:hypothetical protein OPT61_g579 [Boeremia exigua]|uniref:Uncharacterized protein n=1 Tax=Boeremia exigua TaxID=749465 RepID=A0ACC2ITD4_9PLEO|nr:hypothetical protein OPT61_g579 [Boeremia exigua]
MYATQKSLAILGTATVFNAISALAQNLTYGADNFYRSNNVTLYPITFLNQFQMTVAGNLFVPDNLDRSVNASAIVIGHPMGAVKEQAANLYATKLAEQGFVTVALDVSYWGASEGEPRNTVLPDVYSESFSAAVDYLGTLGYVDRRRIGAVGVCGSGSFVISAAKIDSRIAAVATSSMYDMGAANRDGLRNAITIEARKEQVVAASQQRWVETDGGERQYIGGTPHELTNETDAVSAEFFDFYRTVRGESTPLGSSPNLTTHSTLASNVRFHNFYPLSDISIISPRPVLFIAGDQAHSREFSENAYELAEEPKELLWVSGAGHTDLYDRVELIPFAKLTSFFQTSLSGGANRTAID